MHFGVYYDFRNLPGEPLTKLFHETLDDIQAVEQLGYHSAWVSEHHFLDDSHGSAVFPLLAAAALKTSRIRLGTYVLLLPLHHPVRVAEDAAAIDILSDGRLILGVSAGYRTREFTGLGVDFRKRGQLMEEGLKIIRSCWTEEDFSFEGQCWKFRDVHMATKPVQKPTPPIWVGGHAPAAIDRAVRLGDGVLLAAPDAAPGYGEYLQTLARHGKERKNVSVSTLRMVFVGETSEQAWQDCGPPLMYQQNQYELWHRESGDLGANANRRPVSSPDELPRQNFIVGDPTSCIQQIRDAQVNAPADVMITCGRLPGMSRKKALKSLELLAKEVIPYV